MRLDGLVNNSSMNILGAGNLFTTGKVTYVSSVIGNDNNVGDDPLFPKSTIGGGQTASTASVNDVVAIMPGYAETRTAVLTLSKAGVSYVGLGRGTNKPQMTINGAVDCVSITAANVIVNGFNFLIASTDAATAFINVAGAGAGLYNISGVGSVTSYNVVDCITLASGANDCVIQGLHLTNSVVAVNSFLSIEAAVARLVVQDAYMFGDCATAGIIDAATATHLFMDNVSVATVGTSIPAATLDSNPTGIIQNSKFAGTSTTIANNAALGTGVRLFNVLVLEETDGSKQGALIPAVDVD